MLQKGITNAFYVIFAFAGLWEFIMELVTEQWICNSGLRRRGYSIVKIFNS